MKQRTPELDDFVEFDIGSRFSDTDTYVNLLDYGSGLHLDLIRVKGNTQNKRIGTVVMQKIMKYAYKHSRHVTLELTDYYKMDINRLAEFYRRFRFVEGNLSEAVYKHDMYWLPMKR